MRSYRRVTTQFVDAIQWSGSNLDELVSEGYPLPATIHEGNILRLKQGWWNVQSLRPGDYLVKSGRKFEVVAQDVFDKYYQQAG